MRVSRQFYFLNKKSFTHTKSSKTHISDEQKQKRLRFYALKKTSKGKKVAYSLICVFMLFMCFLCFLCFFVCETKKIAFLCAQKTPKKKKIACLTFCACCTFCAFYAHKKHLSESCVFAFCAFCAFCAFRVREIFSVKNKTALIPSFILLLTSCITLHAAKTVMNFFLCY